MKVPYLDLTRLHKSLYAELVGAFEQRLNDGRFVGGDAVRRFEREFAAAHGQDDAVACGSGTDALVLALQALGIGSGHEVVVPAMTFFATAEAVCRVGATPVLADVDPVTLLLTPSTVAEVLTTRTRAVVPVHLHGHVVPMEHLTHWRTVGLVVVEDAAQAHRASDRGSWVGSKGHAACFSFFPGKNLGALGDGGLVMSDDGEVLQTARILRDHGRTTKDLHEAIGYCSRLDALQASLLSVKLAELPVWDHRRAALATRYHDRLAALGDLGAMSLVPWRAGDVHHHLVVRLPAERRPLVIQRLRERGVETGVHYPVSLSRQPALAAWTRPCPVSELVADEVLSLPIDPLMTLDEVDYVCDALAGSLS